MRTHIRKMILSEALRQGLRPNALAALVAPHVSRSQVYDFMGGKHDLTTDKANHLLRALGLKVVRNSVVAPASESTRD